jgi:hypothetical protein
MEQPRAKRVNRKKRQGGRRKGKAGVANQTHQVINTTVHYGKATYPKLPREMEFSSKYSTYDIRAANTTPSTRLFGLIDFYNQLPAYAASFYQIYKYARINAITLEVEVVCTGTEPVIIAADILPYTQANSSLVDPHFIASRPRAISKITGSATGMSRVSLRKTWKTAECTGQLNYSDVAWQSYSEALSVIPDPDHPFLCVSVDSVLSSGTWAAEVVYHVTYHMQFFEQQDPSLTITPEEFRDRRLNAMDEEPLPHAKQSMRQSSADDSFRSRVSKKK